MPTATPATAKAVPFTVSSDRHAPTTLLLAGTVHQAGSRQVEALAEQARGGTDAEVVLDLGGVTGTTDALVATVTRLARDGAVVLRVPEGPLADALEASAGGGTVRLERTRELPASPERRVRAPAAGGPTPGTPRRAGPGFVTSYGEARRCATPGCDVLLSRYNERAVCSVHA